MKDDNIIRVNDVVWVLPTQELLGQHCPYVNMEGVVTDALRPRQALAIPFGLLVTVETYQVKMQDGQDCAFLPQDLRKKRGFDPPEEIISAELYEAGRPHHINCRCTVETA